MDKIKIVPYQEGQEIIIHQLVKKVYDEFVAIDYTSEGNNFFYDWIQPSKIAERQQKQTNILLAFRNTVLAGMIEIRDQKFISLLFVDKKFQKQGIARRLFYEILKMCIEKKQLPEKFFVHASPYSISVYKKLGFVEAGGMQEEFGIKYLPMGARSEELIADAKYMLFVLGN